MSFLGVIRLTNNLRKRDGCTGVQEGNTTDQADFTQDRTARGFIRPEKCVNHKDSVLTLRRIGSIGGCWSAVVLG